MRKKTVLIHSNHSKSKSGFGRHTKELLTYLYKTGKYNLVEYCTGLNWSAEHLKKMPWKAYGVLPDTNEEWGRALQGLNPHEQEIRKRDIAYGALNIDRVIKQERPDVYIGIEDIWAFTGYFDKKWWSKINCVMHTTLDSLPILPDAVSAADKIKHYYVWAKFAEKAMHDMGHSHVRTVHGAIDSSKFYRLSDSQRLEIRRKNKIPDDAFIIGFVFRNQLRKSVVKVLQGFKTFCEQNPECNAYLLLHTHWTEGWNIPERIKEVGVDPSRVLTTYVCRSCKQYEVKPYALSPEAYAQQKINVEAGQNQPCRFCGSKNGQVTANPTDGVTEEQLNEVYNLMDVYAHAFTSGGQEIPVQEAKLTELITLVTNYSCGEDWCTTESGGLPLDWEEYREPGTEFIKASTFSSSIAKQLKKVWKMKTEDRRKMGKIAREYVLKTCDISVVCKYFEDLIDSFEPISWDFDFSEPKKNPSYVPAPIEDDKEWLKDLYRNILLMYVKDDDKGLLNWMKWLKDGSHTRESTLHYFRTLAANLNKEQEKTDFGELFDKNGRKRVLFVLKESLGDCFIVTSLFKSLKEQYPEHDIYIGVEPKYADVFLGNPYVHKIIPYHPAMESELAMVGQGKSEGYVNVYMNPAISTQRQLNYLSNNNIGLDLKGEELT